MNKQLSVYLNDRLTGHLRDIGNARLEFTYADVYLKDAPVALSKSLPLTDKAFDDSAARPFFSGLLPDDQELERLAQYLKVSKQNVFKLLALVGGECAGAVSLFETQKPTEAERPSNQQVSEAQLERILLSATTRPMLGGDDKVRLSLAGAQSKLAVVIDGDTVCLSSPAKPSTHILKPPSSHVDGLVQNEYFCMQLAAIIGFEVPNSTIRAVGNTHVYQVQRYDRVTNDHYSVRLHQEDFCQALGVVPENKYEAEGGPGLQDCVDLIQKHSKTPALDYQQLLDRIVFNYLIGNNDAHAKNFSLLYRGDNASLAPAYDLVSTAVYQNLNPKMAMKIGGRTIAEDLRRRHWERLVPDTQTSKKVQKDRALALCSGIENALSSGEFAQRIAEHKHSIIDDVIDLIQSRIEKLRKVFLEPQY